jgi:NADH:ubiquinone oxidoreductase subunit H
MKAYGPNRVGFIGLFQPFSDAIKLFTREQYFPLVSNYLSYYFSPIFGLRPRCWIKMNFWRRGYVMYK